MKLSVSFCLTIFFVFLSSLIIGTTPFLFDLLTIKAIQREKLLEEHLGTTFSAIPQDRSNRYSQ